MGQVKSRRSGLAKSKANADEKSNYDKTETATNYNPACIIDILVDDVLLKIFSFLTIFETITASRTCKRWHSLIREPHLWQTIDFWNGYNLHSPWQSEQDEANYTKKLANTTMRFLQFYTDSSLRVVYLRASNWAVMRHLINKCPNLQTLSFLSPDQHTPSTCSKDIYSCIDFTFNMESMFAKFHDWSERTLHKLTVQKQRHEFLVVQ
ncbi:S-phase kinase-associated protein 2-like [Amphiura filiformis]|uniref:S-phase kinase-associated protein 2-like n=1 Tax=Amphiura filiformis TaxID=82378 RepID=UPI003B212002